MSLFSGARLKSGALVLTLLSSATFAAPVFAQSASGGNGGWFVPKAAEEPKAAPAQRVVRRAVPVQEADDGGQGDDGGQPQQSETAPVLPLPPIPDSPDLPKEAPPPPSIIGVISVPNVMRMSSAADEAQRILGGRRDTLAAAAQKEQAAWRAEQQKLQTDARSLSSDQIQARERHLQERRAKAQRDFANRARIIQEAANVSLNQIERELVRIVRQVAQAHGMNIVMHSEQIALHVPEQDITQEVANQLNKILPHVFIPAEDVDPEVMAKSGKFPTTADPAQADDQAPASAPAQSASVPADSVLRRHR